MNRVNNNLPMMVFTSSMEDPAPAETASHESTWTYGNSRTPALNNLSKYTKKKRVGANVLGKLLRNLKHINQSYKPYIKILFMNRVVRLNCKARNTTLSKKKNLISVSFQNINNTTIHTKNNRSVCIYETFFFSRYV